MSNLKILMPIDLWMSLELIEVISNEAKICHGKERRRSA